MLLSKKELKYLNNAKIYKLVCNVTGDVYYGSTIKSLKQRLSKHECDYKRYLNGKIRYYTTSFKIIENGDYNIYLVENYRCMNKKQLESIEGIYIRYNKCINKCVVGRTLKESYKVYYENNKHKLNKYNKEYYENNKHKLKEKFDCECGGKYTYQNKLSHMKTNKHQKYLLRKEYLLPNFKSCSL